MDGWMYGLMVELMAMGTTIAMATCAIPELSSTMSPEFLLNWEFVCAIMLQSKIFFAFVWEYLTQI